MKGLKMGKTLHAIPVKKKCTGLKKIFQEQKAENIFVASLVKQCGGILILVAKNTKIGKTEIVHTERFC
ncbi:MAG TPA: hypothetical protein ENI66_01765 [Candidatus Yonathbacteria bacterium]|nr:hypothetical protein [Candidatus Yonathbacteria bacterium]